MSDKDEILRLLNVRRVSKTIEDLTLYLNDPEIQRDVDETLRRAKERFAIMRERHPKLADKIDFGEELTPEEIALLAQAKMWFKLETFF